MFDDSGNIAPIVLILVALCCAWFAGRAEGWKKGFQDGWNAPACGLCASDQEDGFSGDHGSHVFYKGRWKQSRPPSFP